MENVIAMRIETDEARLAQMVERLNRVLGDQGSAELVAGDDGMAKVRVRMAGIDEARDFTPVCSEMERGLRIQSEGGRVVRFAPLPHLKPIVVPERDGLFSVALLALEYLNADPVTGNYLKLADGSYPPVGWRVGYVMLSFFELRQLSALSEDCSCQSLYGYDLGMYARREPGEADIFIKNLKLPAWKRHPEVAKKVEEAAQRLAQNGGAKLLEMLGRQATVEDWDALAARGLGKGIPDKSGGDPAGSPLLGTGGAA
jgi:hypothetical protein